MDYHFQRGRMVSPATVGQLELNLNHIQTGVDELSVFNMRKNTGELKEKLTMK